MIAKIPSLKPCFIATMNLICSLTIGTHHSERASIAKSRADWCFRVKNIAVWRWPTLSSNVWDKTPERAFYFFGEPRLTPMLPLLLTELFFETNDWCAANTSPPDVSEYHRILKRKVVSNPQFADLTRLSASRLHRSFYREKPVNEDDLPLG